MKLPSFEIILKLTFIWCVVMLTILAGVGIYLQIKNEGASVNKVQLSIPPAPKKK